MGNRLSNPGRPAVKAAEEALSVGLRVAGWASAENSPADHPRNPAGIGLSAWVDPPSVCKGRPPGRYEFFSVSGFGSGPRILRLSSEGYSAG